MENNRPVQVMQEGPIADSDELRFHEVFVKAYTDRDFRKRLITNPKEVLRREGIVFPDDVRITVHEFDPNDRHLFLLPLELPVPRGSQRPPNAAPTDPEPTSAFRPGAVRAFLLPSQGGIEGEVNNG